MKNSLGTRIIVSICLVLLLILLTSGLSYAVFKYSKTGNKDNTVNTGTITFTYNETSNGIALTNAQPMTDNAGKVLQKTDDANGATQGYFDFTVSANMSNNIPITYEVYGSVESESTIDPKYIKVYLTDGSTNDRAIEGYTGSVVPVYSSLPEAVSNPNGKKLYTETFTKSALKTFRLRLWIASNYDNEATSQKFIMKVNVATVD